MKVQTKKAKTRGAEISVADERTERSTSQPRFTLRSAITLYVAATN